ncbi:YncE family protein [Actinoplanes sp. CA-015351]|uniref:YncE family protein n=1 Tax=Actinoplanes sp. CA-015351 TaxID=3239897 RepID=UPI003D95A03E
MTTRRNFLVLAGAGLALTACRSRSSAAFSLQDVLLVETDRGLVRASSSGRQVIGHAATLSHDGRFLYSARSDGLDQIDPVSGAVIRSDGYGGGWQPRAISSDGRSCALTPALPGAIPAGRDWSPILIAAPGGPRKFRLPGVIEPDAFTSDASGLFVLEWLPATAPDHYRVRLLDLNSGELHPLNTRDKTPVPPGAEEEMRGEGRQAVLSADGAMLFTLYTHQPGHAHTRDLLSGRPGNAHAFVHVLHLTDGWAYCLDLPHPFGTSAPQAHALAADARHIAVADLGAGKIAYADPSTLTITRVLDVPPAASAFSKPPSASAFSRPPAASAFSKPPAASAFLKLTATHAFVGGGDTVTALDRSTDAVTASRSLPGPLRGLALTPDGLRLHAATADQVHCLKTPSGTPTGTTPIPSLQALHTAH